MTAGAMRILDRSVYVGPSHYARFPVIRLELDLGALEAWPTGKLGRGFVDGLSRHCPASPSTAAPTASRGGFVRRMNEDEGTWLGHVLEHVAIELQNVAGEDVTFGKTRSLDRPGHYYVVYEYARTEEGVEAGELALRLLCSLLPEKLRPAGQRARGLELADRARRVIRYAQRRALGPSTASLVHAAEERGIPWLRLNDQSLVQLGHGKYQQRIQATVTGRTPHIAVEIASDKEETNQHPRRARPAGAAPGAGADGARGGARRGPARLPGRHQALQRQPRPRRLDPPARATRRSRTASQRAREHSRSVIVETFLEGDDHRLLVVNGELVAATRRTPGHVIGDGEHTIAELVEIVNQDPRRGVGHEKVLTRLEIDAQAETMLARGGLAADSVPDAGRRSCTCARPPTSRPAARRSTSPTSSTPTTATWRCAPSRRSASTSAASTSCRRTSRCRYQDDRRRHLRDQRRAGLPHARRADRGHAARRRRAGDRHAVPAGRAGARPDRGDHRHQRQDHDGAHGRAHPQDGGLHAGPHHDRRRLHRRPAHGRGRHDRPGAARMVLADPHVDAAVLETARGGLLRAGLGVPDVDVGAVLNVAGRPPRPQGHRDARAARRGQARRRRGRHATARC